MFLMGIILLSKIFFPTFYHYNIRIYILIFYGGDYLGEMKEGIDMKRRIVFNDPDIKPQKCSMDLSVKDSLSYQYAILSAILKCSPTAIWVVDMDDELIFMNSVILNELDIKTIQEIDQDIKDEMIADSDIVIYTNSKLFYSKTLIFNNQKRIFDIQKVRLEDFEGKVLGMLGMAIYQSEDKINTEKVEYLSYHDSLTGLYNRAYFDIKILELDRSELIPVSVLLGDVNGLKLTNDAFGHTVGDELLKSVAECIKNMCRDHDIAVRLGGDEFAIVLPETTYEEARIVEGRLKQKINEIEGFKITPSISFGVATKLYPDQKLMQLFSVAEDDMYAQKFIEGKSLRNSILSTLQDSLKRMDLADEASAVIDIRELIEKISKKLKLKKTQIRLLLLLAEYKDIGKLSISDDILLKIDELTDSDWKVIKKHPEVGYRIAMASKGLSIIAEDILYHHEHFDGGGYPRGLAGEEIPINSRIIAVLDAFFALVNDRKYRKRYTCCEACNIIESEKGEKYDPKIVDIFKKILLDILEENGYKSPCIEELVENK